MFTILNNNPLNYQAHISKTPKRDFGVYCWGFNPSNSHPLKKNKKNNLPNLTPLLLLLFHSYTFLSLVVIISTSKKSPG